MDVNLVFYTIDRLLVVGLFWWIV